tara:strand:- start:1436 stop:3400 length:1965 start_codon:yes stop_codon:yes gene_type:complete
MCGILGFWFPTEIDNDYFSSIFNSMSKRLSHRGPDNFGKWHDPAFGINFAHQRLSILDLSSSGNQPMKSQNGRYIITFNGEIYNHLQLRKSLEDENLTHSEWNGKSDTETLLACIEAYGLEIAVKKLVGMFAFAVWDRKLKQLYLVRDRFGEKPLFWGLLNSKTNLKNNSIFKGDLPILFFASELSILKELPEVNLEVDPESQASFLNYGYIPEPLSIYKNIHKLPANTIYKFSSNSEGFFSNKEPERIKYWDFVHLLDDKYTSSEEAIINLEYGLERSIKDQSISDVPMGVFLSGGIDSSLITSIFQEQNSRPIKSFSIGFKDSGLGEKYFDESEYSSSIANYLGTDHTQIQLEAKDFLNIIPNISSVYSEPFADPSQLPTYILSKITRDTGVKVALSGDGGDELFGGYNRHWIAPRLMRLAKYLPNNFKNIISSINYSSILKNDGLNLDKYQKLVRAINSSESVESIYKSLISQWPHVSEFTSLKNIPKIDFLNLNCVSETLLINDLLFYLPSDILTKVDRASMAVGLETRSPFLDHRLASMALRIPLEMKINSKFTQVTSKWILRKILEKKLPKKLINRKKVGFSVPIAKWLKGPLRNWADNLLMEEDLYDNSYLNKNKIEKIWQDHLNSRYDHSLRLWTILMWKSWLNSN